MHILHDEPVVNIPKALVNNHAECNHCMSNQCIRQGSCMQLLMEYMGVLMGKMR